MHVNFTRRNALLGGGLAALGLASCSSSEGAGDGGGSGASETITIGYMEAWTDTVSLAFLLQDRLTALGYDVEFEVLADAAIAYTALDNGDIDLLSSGWPDVTHAEYMEEYGQNVEDLVTYNANATNMLAVPEYMDVSSIEELATDPDRFGGRIVGIEPGAGLTGIVQDSVIPTYGLDGGFELVTSSTAAMLTELGNAMDAQEDIVVTLWRPFWANQEFAVQPLEDPERAFGEPETMHVLGRDGFSEDFADAAEYIGQLELTDEEYETLENTIVNDYDSGQEADAVQQWRKENPNVLPAVDED
ncbi:glycine betaine ABC transporter substrate-binding protein [Brachybacterium sp. GCM10030267]|uniref:glycine betaine ABC transporter substrate-binding protein n=1 Tax=Brachybacterium sp. GCM10030267 TaxID=3273381 RepID=UPI0036079CE5